MLPVFISGSNSCDIVELDVGGTNFHVSYSTLTRIPSKIADVLKSCNTRKIFIDADADAFKPILQYLRTNTVAWDSLTQDTKLLAQQLNIILPEKAAFPHETPSYSPYPTHVNSGNRNQGYTKEPVSIHENYETLACSPVLAPYTPYSQAATNLAPNFSPAMPVPDVKLNTIFVHVISERDISNEISALQAVLNQNNMLDKHVKLSTQFHPHTMASIYVHNPLISRVDEEVKSYRFSNELANKVPEGALVLIFAKISNSSFREIHEYKIGKKQIFVIFFESGNIKPASTGIKFVCK